jgi:hypothetical protein
MAIARCAFVQSYGSEILDASHLIDPTAFLSIKVRKHGIVPYFMSVMKAPNAGVYLARIFTIRAVFEFERASVALNYRQPYSAIVRRAGTCLSAAGCCRIRAAFSAAIFDQYLRRTRAICEGSAIVTVLPADEDYAMSLLSVFRSARVHARQTLDAQSVEREFLANNMGRQADFKAGLELAVDREWLKLELNRIRLTEKGFDEQ